MEDIERLLIERSCERLMVEYCHLVDHGQAERIADLFTEDGVWKSPEVEMNGREQLRKGFGRRQAQRGRISRHVCNNLLVHVIDAETAEGTVYLTLFREDGEEGRRAASLEAQPQFVGEYRDRFRKTADGWRISSREIQVGFVRAPAS